MNGQQQRRDTANDEHDEKLHSLDVIRSWPAESREPAGWIVHGHHEPDEVSDEQLVWKHVAPWHQVIATREFESRDWPVPHTASVRSIIRYQVPESAAALVDELALPIDVDRDRGLVTTLGPDLRTNLLTLNLMHDVVTGALTPGDARRRYADVTTTPPNGHPPVDMVKCRFDDEPPPEPDAVPPSDPTGPPDHRVREVMPTAPPPDRASESTVDDDRRPQDQAS